MAWESRHGTRYYYRKKKRHGRVTSEYVGRGQVAELVAAVDDVERHTRRMDRQALRRLQAQGQQVDQAIEGFRRQAQATVAAILHQAGFYQHKRGEWRKRRGENENMPNEITTERPSDVGVLAHTVVTQALEQAGIGKDPEAKKKLMAEINGLRMRLGWADAPQHERLLIENIALCWLRVQFVEQLLSQNSSESNYKMPVVEHFERRLSFAHRRFIAATTALAKVRRLDIHQINIAHQQIVQNGR